MKQGEAGEEGSTPGKAAAALLSTPEQFSPSAPPWLAVLELPSEEALTNMARLHGGGFGREEGEEAFLEEEEEPVPEITESVVFRRENLPLLGLVLLYSFFAAALISIASPFLPTALADVGIPPPKAGGPVAGYEESSSLLVGLIFSVYPLANLLLAPVCTPICQRYGRRNVLIFGIMLESATAAVMGIMKPTFGNAKWIAYVYLVLRVAQGSGAALSYTALLAFCAERFGGDGGGLGTLIGFQEGVAGVGYMVGPPLGALLEILGEKTGKGNGFTFPFVTMAVGLACVLPFIPLALPDGGKVNALRRHRDGLDLDEVSVDGAEVLDDADVRGHLEGMRQPLLDTVGEDEPAHPLPLQHGSGWGTLHGELTHPHHAPAHPHASPHQPPHVFVPHVHEVEEAQQTALEAGRGTVAARLAAAAAAPAEPPGGRHRQPPAPPPPPASVDMLSECPPSLDAKGGLVMEDFLQYPELSFWAVARLPQVINGSIVTMLAAIGFGYITPTLQQHLHSELGAGTGLVGALFGLTAATYAMGAPISGWLADRYGHTRVLTVGIIGMGVAYLLLGPTPLLGLSGALPHVLLWLLAVTSLLMLGAFASLAFIPCMPVMEAAASDRFGESSGVGETVASLYNGVYCAGEAAGPLVGSLLTSKLGFKWGTTLVAALLFLYGLVFTAFTAQQHPWVQWMVPRRWKVGAGAMEQGEQGGVSAMFGEPLLGEEDDYGGEEEEDAAVLRHAQHGYGW